jgi:hypothetical protein
VKVSTVQLLWEFRSVLLALAEERKHKAPRVPSIATIEDLLRRVDEELRDR